MDSSEIKQIIARLFTKGEETFVDPVVYGSDIIELRASVGIADRDVIVPRIVSFINGDDFGRRKAMYGCHHRCFYQSRVGEGQKIEVVVNEVEFGSFFHQITNMQAFGNLRIDFFIFFVSSFDDAVEFSFREGVFGRKKGYVYTSFNQSFGNIGSYLFPRAVVTRRCAPRHR